MEQSTGKIKGKIIYDCSKAFYLSDRYELGCVECFCMGVSRSCQSTSWNRAQVRDKGKSFDFLPE